MGHRAVSTPYSVISTESSSCRKCGADGRVASKKPIATNSIDTFATGLATRIPDARAVEIINQNAARVITVNDDEILHAQALLLRDTHNLSEPAGAAAYAALLKERHRMARKRVGVILSGGNADIPNVLAIAQLRLNSGGP